MGEGGYVRCVCVRSDGRGGAGLGLHVHAHDAAGFHDTFLLRCGNAEGKSLKQCEKKRKSVPLRFGVPMGQLGVYRTLVFWSGLLIFGVPMGQLGI